MSSVPETQHHEGKHPTFKQYVFIALILFVITAVEFVIIVPESMQGAPVSLAPLIILSAIKFGIVIMYYMHLRFDHRLLSIVFLSGLVLAFAAFSWLMILFSAFTPEPREYAKAHAVPFTHGESGHMAKADDGSHGADSGHVESHSEEETEPVAESSSSASDGMVGQGVFTGGAGCAGCHMIEGVPGAVGQLGPDLTNIGTVAATRVSGTTARDYIVESIKNPTAYLVDGYAPIMPAGLADQMTDDEFNSLVDFLMSKQ